MVSGSCSSARRCWRRVRSFVLGRLRFLLCGGQHALIGVPQWLPAGGALTRFAQRFKLLYTRALLLQARLQGA